MSESITPEKTPGIFGWNELITTDPDAAESFYTSVFGWQAEVATMAPGLDYTMFNLNGRPVAGMIGITADMGPVHPQWMSYVNSADVDADLAKAKAAGGTVLKEKTEIPNAGTLGIIQDPTGAVFSLWKPADGC